MNPNNIVTYDTRMPHTSLHTLLTRALMHEKKEQRNV